MWAVAGENFFLASSAVLPILIFGETLTSGVAVALPIPTEVATRMNRIGPRVAALAGVFWWAFYAWAEWICLRSLEPGRPATGGTTVVWIALSMAAYQLASYELLARVFGTRATRDPGRRLFGARRPPPEDS